MYPGVMPTEKVRMAVCTGVEQSELALAAFPACGMAQGYLDAVEIVSSRFWYCVTLPHTLGLVSRSVTVTDEAYIII